jgi:glucose-6-phosphate 1-dehydrogenase
VDTPRWRGVPFLLRTGKQLARSDQRVSLIFREPDGPLASDLPPQGNVLSISLSGSGAIALRMVVKEPGPHFSLSRTASSVDLGKIDGADPLPPYVRLISDAIAGDRTLFTRPDGLAHAWDAITPVLENPPEVKPYARGSWGPEAAAALAEPDGWIIESEGSQKAT